MLIPGFSFNEYLNLPLALMLMTEWNQYRGMDLEKVKKVVERFEVLPVETAPEVWAASDPG